MTKEKVFLEKIGKFCFSAFSLLVKRANPKKICLLLALKGSFALT